MRYKNSLALSMALGLVALPAMSPSVLAQGSDADELDFLFGEESSTEPRPLDGAAEASRPDGPSASEPLDTVSVPDSTAEPAPDAGKKPSAGRSRLVEEIVVTAQKREENILDVPISIAAFSGAALDAKGINDAKSLAQSVPGVTYGETVNFSIIYVRGVGTDAFLPDSDLSVAMYLDGIYFPFANGLSQALGAIERVEVLKGPQGTLFGRNSTGGAFNILSRKPDLEGPSLELSSGWGRYNTWNNRVYANVPLTDSLAANVSLTYNRGDNYYNGTRGQFGTAERQGFPTETEEGGRLRVMWMPNDFVDLTLSAIKHQKDGLASSAMPNIAPSAVLQTLYIATAGMGQAYEVPPEYTVNIDVASFFNLDNEVFYGELGLHPSWFDVKLLSSYQEVRTDNNYDFDGTEAPLITFDARGQFADVFTGELQFISNGQSGPDWLTWVGGVYYLDQSVGFPANRLSAGGLDLLVDGTIAGLVPIPGPVLDGYEQAANFLIGLGLPLFPDGVNLALVSLQDVEATAFFGQATFHITDWLGLTLGGRYQEETRKVVESSINSFNVDGSTSLLLDFGSPSQDDTNFSPKVVLEWTPADGRLVYVNWSKGFKSGTFNTVNVYDQPEYILPEEVTTTELGAKLTLADGQVQFNTALFDTEIQNQQVQFISLLAGGAVQLENAAQVSIFGGEVEVTYSPFWDEGLFTSLSLTYLDTEYDSYPNASGYGNPATGAAFDPPNEPIGLYNFQGGDFTGNRTIRTPEWSGNLTVNKVFGLSHGDVELGATGYFSTDLFFQASNTNISRQDDYQTLDAQVSYLHHRSNVRLSLLGKNLTDERYQLTQFHTDAGVQHVLAPPTTFAVRVDWTFQ